MTVKTQKTGFYGLREDFSLFLLFFFFRDMFLSFLMPIRIPKKESGRESPDCVAARDLVNGRSRTVNENVHRAVESEQLAQRWEGFT